MRRIASGKMREMTQADDRGEKIGGMKARIKWIARMTWACGVLVFVAGAAGNAWAQTSQACWAASHFQPIWDAGAGRCREAVAGQDEGACGEIFSATSAGLFSAVIDGACSHGTPEDSCLSPGVAVIGPNLVGSEISAGEVGGCVFLSQCTGDLGAFIVDNLCTYPRSDQDCMDLIPDEPIFEESDSNRCRPATSNQDCMNADHTPPAPIFASGTCRLPGNNTECALAYPDEPFYDEDEANNCRPQVNDGECRMIFPGRPIYDPFVPDDCRAAEDGEECASAFPDRPFHDEDAVDTFFCRVAEGVEECRMAFPNRPYYDESEASNCRAATDFAECRAAFPNMPVFDRGEPSNCRSPINDFECGNFFGNQGRPVFQEGEPGNCRAPVNTAECLRFSEPGRPMIFGGAGAGAQCIDPGNSQQCQEANRAMPIFGSDLEIAGVSHGLTGDLDRCFAGTDEYCEAIYPDAPRAGADGSCRARTEGDCDNTEKFEGGECVPLEPEDCADDEYFDRGLCLLITAAYCESIDRILADDGACRRPNEALDCIPNGMVLFEGACLAPATDEECIRLNPGFIYAGAGAGCRYRNRDECPAGFFFDSGQCKDEADECGGDQRKVTERDGSREYTYCAAPENFDCIPSGQVAGAQGCRLPSNDEECALVSEAAPFFRDGRCHATAEPAIVQAASGGGESSAEKARQNLLFAAPFVAAASYILYSSSPAFSPRFNFAGDDAEGVQWDSAGRLEFSEGSFSSYLSATYAAKHGGPVYETGGAHQGAGWKASYRTREAAEFREYEFSIGGAWDAGMWQFNPSWKSGLEYDAEDAEWTSSTGLGMDMLWASHKWRARQNAGFAWDSDGDWAAPKIRLDVNRDF